MGNKYFGIDDDEEDESIDIDWVTDWKERQDQMSKYGYYGDKEQEKALSKGGGNKGGKHYTSDAKGTKAHIPKCPIPHEKDFAFEHEGVTYYGGSTRGWTDELFCMKPTLLISLNNTNPKIKHEIERVKVLPKGMDVKRYFPDNEAIPMVIDWKDFGEPPFRFGFARMIHNYCKRENISEVVLFCTGGHGRTGTMLSSFVIELAELPYQDAVSIIRAVYCKHAVETLGQEKWLKLNEAWVQANKMKKTIDENGEIKR